MYLSSHVWVSANPLAYFTRLVITNVSEHIPTSILVSSSKTVMNLLGIETRTLYDALLLQSQTSGLRVL